MAITNLRLTPDDHLHPCPFCGSTELELHNTHTACYWIECGCGVEVTGENFSGGYRSERIPRARHEKAKASAIAAWNRRTQAASVYDRDRLIDVMVLAMANDLYGSVGHALDLLDGKPPTTSCQERGLAVARALGHGPRAAKSSGLDGPFYERITNG